MINSKVKIDYFDQNESFAQFLPRIGQITRQLVDEYGNTNWFLVKLDKPFEYQLKTGDNFKFELINCNNLLIRSRWKNQEINKDEDTSVFIMLIHKETKLLTLPIKINDYIHVAWGSAKIINDLPPKETTEQRGFPL